MKNDMNGQKTKLTVSGRMGAPKRGAVTCNYCGKSVPDNTRARRAHEVGCWPPKR